MTANEMYARAFIRKALPSLPDATVNELARIAQEHGTKHGWSVLAYTNMAIRTLQRGGSVHGISADPSSQDGI